MMGMIVDKTNTRFGKFRPFILIVPFFMAITMIALFSTPEMSAGKELAWVSVFYVLSGMLFTAYDVPVMSMAPAITTNPNERTSLLSLSRMFTMVGILGTSVVALPLINYFGKGDAAVGYRYLIVIFAVISVISSTIMFLNTKERHVQRGKKNSLSDYKKLIKLNQPFFIIIISMVILNIAGNLTTAIQIYYYKDVVGRPDLIPLFMMFGFLTLLGYPAIPTLSKKFGLIKLSVYSTLVCAITSILLYFVRDNLVILSILNIIRVIANTIPFVTMISMLAQTVDYGEWKTGVRSESIIFSMNSFAIKLGMAFGTGLVGFILSFSKYVPNEVQAVGTANWINATFSFIPAIFYLIVTFIIMKYDLTDDKYMKIIDELDEKRNAAVI